MLFIRSTLSKLQSRTCKRAKYCCIYICTILYNMLISLYIMTTIIYFFNSYLLDTVPSDKPVKENMSMFLQSIPCYTPNIITLELFISYKIKMSDRGLNMKQHEREREREKERKTKTKK